MSKNEIITKIEAIRELEELIAEAAAEADALRDAIKQMMLASNTEELEAGQYIVRYQSIVTNKFNTSEFKKLMPDVYKSFLRQSTSKRFSIA